MAKSDITYQLISGIPESKTLTELENLYSTIFSDADVAFFRKRYHEKENLLTVVAYHNYKLIGFKTGYTYNKTTFYSWVGGVLKSYRNKGVASELAQLQERWARENNYTKLRTKSMNKFKPMMCLNLKNGFDIVQVYTNEKQQTKIIFEKNIT